MDDTERLQVLDLEDRLRFARGEVKELKKEVKRLKELLNGEDVIMNSLTSTPFDKLKSSYRHKK